MRKMHGFRHTKVYQAVANMKLRCRAKSHKRYHIYSKLGYDPAFNDYGYACQWFLENGWFEGCHTHRIDAERGYFKDNIQFLDRIEHKQLHAAEQARSGGQFTSRWAVEEI